MSNLGDVLVKKPYIKIPYTNKQMEELGSCADQKYGPRYYMENFFYIQHPLRGRIPFVPFDYQIELIENYHNHRFSINMLGRQMGKCSTKDMNITVRNKATGKIYDIPIGEFFEYQKDKSTDISKYERKDI